MRRQFWAGSRRQYLTFAFFLSALACYKWSILPSSHPRSQASRLKWELVMSFCQCFPCIASPSHFSLHSSSCNPPLWLCRRRYSCISPRGHADLACQCLSHLQPWREGWIWASPREAKTQPASALHSHGLLWEKSGSCPPLHGHNCARYWQAWSCNFSLRILDPFSPSWSQPRKAQSTLPCIVLVVDCKTLSGQKKQEGEMRGGKAGEASSEQHCKLPLEPRGMYFWLASTEDRSFIEVVGPEQQQEGKS